MAYNTQSENVIHSRFSMSYYNVGGEGSLVHTRIESDHCVHTLQSSQASDSHTMYLPQWINRAYRFILNIFVCISTFEQSTQHYTYIDTLCNVIVFIQFYILLFTIIHEIHTCAINAYH